MVLFRYRRGVGVACPGFAGGLLVQVRKGAVQVSQEGCPGIGRGGCSGIDYDIPFLFWRVCRYRRGVVQVS